MGPSITRRVVIKAYAVYNVGTKAIWWERFRADQFFDFVRNAEGAKGPEPLRQKNRQHFFVSGERFRNLKACDESTEGERLRAEISQVNGQRGELDDVSTMRAGQASFVWIIALNLKRTIFLCKFVPVATTVTKDFA